MPKRKIKEVAGVIRKAAPVQDALTAARESLRINVIAHRARMRLTQRDLSERAGVARAVVSKMENADGDFNVSTVARIASVVGCSVSDLLRPAFLAPVGNDELRRRFAAPEAEWSSSDSLFAAIGEVYAQRTHLAGAESLDVAYHREALKSLAALAGQSPKNPPILRALEDALSLTLISTAQRADPLNGTRAIQVERSRVPHGVLGRQTLSNGTDRLRRNTRPRL